MRTLLLNPLILMCAVLAVATGCSRKASDKSSVTFSFSSTSGAGALDDSKITVVVINITGPGIATPIFKQVDVKHKTAATAAADINVTIPDVPRGDNRLIQALLVREDSSGTNTFYYNDVTQSFSKDVEPVEITTTKINTTATAGDASISGRYLNAAGVGPTSAIRVFLPIPNHPEKPAMLVDNGNEMLAGWFRVFSLDGARFNYLLDDGTNMFGGPVGVDSTSFFDHSTDSARTLRVFVPIYYSPGSGLTREPHSASRSVYGWFGPGSSNTSKKICYNGTSGPLTSMHADATSITTLNWNTSVAAPAATDAYVESVFGIHDGYSTTTLDPVLNLCQPSGIIFEDYIPLSEQALSNHDSVLGFKGAYQLQFDSGNSNGGDSLGATVTGNVLTAKLIFLPGVQTNHLAKGIDGIDLYGRIETSSQSNNNGDADYSGDGDGTTACGKLTSLASPFSFLTNSPANVDPVSTGGAMGLPNPQPLPLSLTAAGVPSAFLTAFNSGMSTLIACPYTTNAKGKVYYSSAAIHYPGGGGSMTNPANPQMQIMKLQLVHGTGNAADTEPGALQSSDTTQEVNSCKLYVVNVLDQSGNPAMAPAPINIGLPNGGQISFGTDSSCGTQLNTLTIPQGSPSANLYVKAPSFGTSATFSLNGSGATSPNFSIYFTPVSPGAVYAVFSQIDPPNNNTIPQYMCTPVHIRVQDSSGNPTYFTATPATTFSDNLAAGSLFYDSFANCQAGTVTTFNYPTYSTTATAWYRPFATSAGAQVQTSITGASVVNPSPPVIVDSGSVHVVRINGSSYTNGMWWAAPGCSPVTVGSFTASSYGLLDPYFYGATNFTLSATHGNFYPNPDCTGTPSHSVLNWNVKGGNVAYYKSEGFLSETFSDGVTPISVTFGPAKINLQATNTAVCANMGCSVPLFITLRDELGMPWVAPIGITLNLGADTNFRVAAGRVASSCGAGSQNLGVNVPTGSSFTTAGVCAMTSGASGNIFANWGGSAGGAGASLAFTSNSNAAGSYSKITALGPAPVVGPVIPAKIGACEPILVFPTDPNGMWTFASDAAGTNSGTAYTNNLIYTDPVCGTHATAAAAGFPTSANPNVYYFKDPTGGSTQTFTNTLPTAGAESINLLAQ